MKDIENLARGWWFKTNVCLSDLSWIDYLWPDGKDPGSMASIWYEMALLSEEMLREQE